MRADYINPLLISVMDTLTQITQERPHAGKVKLKKHDFAQGEVTGLVKFKIENQMASMALSFSQELILDLASRMSQKRIRQIDHTVLDVAGRLTYLACSGARQHLHDQDIEFLLTNPQVFEGFRQRIQHVSEERKLTLPLETPAGICFSEISIAGQGDFSCQQGILL